MACTASFNSGTANIKAPRPKLHKLSNKPQPTGTAHTKRSARLRPWLAASAVESVVLGPGEKLMAVASTSRAESSCQFMALTL